MMMILYYNTINIICFMPGRVDLKTAINKIFCKIYGEGGGRGVAGGGRGVTAAMGGGGGGGGMGRGVWGGEGSRQQ